MFLSLLLCCSLLGAHPEEYSAATGGNVLFDYTGNSSGYTYSAEVYDNGYWYHFTTGDDLQVTTYSDIGVVMTFSLDDEFLYYPCRSFTFTSSFTQSATDFVVNEIILTGYNASGTAKKFDLTNLCLMDDLTKSGEQGACRFTFNAVDVGDYCHDVELYIDLEFYNERDDSFYLRSQDWHSWNSGGSGSDISVDDINSGFSSITDSLSGLPKLIAEAIESFFDGLGNIFSYGFSALPTNIKTALSSSFTNLQSAVNGLPAKLKTYFDDLGNIFSGGFIDLGEIYEAGFDALPVDIKTSLTSLFTDLKNSITSLPGNLKAYFDSLGTIFSGGFIDLESAFEDGLSGVPANIAEQLSSFFDSVVSAVKSVPGSLKIYFDNLGTIFSGGFFDLETVFEDGLLGVPANIAEQLRGFFDDVVSSVANLGTSILDGISALFVPSDEKLSSIKDDYIGFFQNRFGALYQSVDILSGIMDSFVEVESRTTIEIPETTFTFMDGLEFTFGGWTVPMIPEGFETFAETTKYFIDVVCTVAFLNMLNARYRAFFK